MRNQSSTDSAPEQRPRAANSRTVLVCVAILYVLAFTFGLSTLTRSGGEVKDAGWTWRRTTEGFVVDAVQPAGPAAVLMPGAYVLAINGDTRARTAGPRPWLQSVHPNQSYTLTWKLPNNPQRFDSMLTMGKRTSNSDLLMGASDLFLSLSFALAGFLVWSAKPRDRVSRPCYAAALLMAFFLIASAIGPVSPLLSGSALIFYFVLRSIAPFQTAAACEFFARFPTGEAPQGGWKWALRLLWIAGAIGWITLLPARVLPHMGLEWRMAILSGLDLNTRPELGLVWFRHGYFVLCGVYLFAVTARNYARVTNAAMRLRVQWVILGGMVGIVPGVFGSVALAAADYWQLLRPEAVRTALSYYSLCTLTLAVMPFTIAYAVLRHRLMGIRLRLPDVYSGAGVRHILHVLSLAPPAAILVFLWTARNTRISDFIRVSPLQMVLLAITLLYTCFRKEILDAVDRVLTRNPYDPDQVTRGLLEVLLEQQSAEAIASVAASRIEHSLKPRVLWCYFGKPQEHPRLAYSRTDHSTPRDRDSEAAVRELMDRGGTIFPVLKSGLVLPESAREWITRNGIVLAVPVAPGAGADPAGIFLLGENSRRQRYTATDLDVVENISRQVCFALKMHDLVTDRDRAVVARRHAEAAVDERSEFLAQMSHELRNPLQGLLGLSGSLLDTPLTEEQQQYAELIHRSGEWMVAIANDVLDFSKLEAGKLKLESVEFEWLPLLEELVAIAAERARSKGLDLVLRTDPAMPDASIGDAARIRQALLNLVDNAVKFTSEGWVVVRAAPAGTAPGSGVRLDVEDSGPGIPDHLRDRLFQPYEQASARRGGTGLGLAITKKLVDAMAGQMSLVSRPGAGTRFTMVLPLPTYRLGQLDDAREPLLGRRILYVDDQSVACEATCMTLLSMGAIPAASNTDLTYPAISHVGGAFHAVLLAARGSARDTLRTVRELRRTEPQTPLIILYYRGVPFEAAEATRLGITDQLRSPATRKRLLRAIEHALGSRRSATVEEPESIEPAVTRVLIVEDDPASARAVEMSLEEIGCLVRSARSADEALAALEAAPADIAFVDRSLPGMDGIELTRRIRSLPGGAAEMRIIALSGSSSEETRNQFFSAGADDCLVKPASREQLQHAIYWTQTARR